MRAFVPSGAHEDDGAFTRGRRRGLTRPGTANSINVDLYKRSLFHRRIRAIPSPARIRGTFIAWAVRPEDLSALRLFHRALADVNRLRIVQRLATSPATVTDLIDTCGLSQPLVSHHLRRLREAGIVLVERHGRESICMLRPETFTEMSAREREILGYAEAPRPGAAAGAEPAVTPAPGHPLPEPAR